MSNVYGFCDNNCRYPVYTQEQVLSILQQLIENGTLQGIDPALSPVVALIREKHANGDVSLWIGTEAEYNEIAPGAALVMGRIGDDGTLYFCSDDTTLQAWHDATVQDAADTVNAIIEANANLDINKKQDKHFTATVSLEVGSWSNNAQTVNVENVTESNTVFVAPDPASQDEYTSAGIKCTEQAAGSLTFTCNKKPAAAVTVNIVIFN